MKIYFINGINAGESRELDKPAISIGREVDNDISILTAGVSRYHARFSCGADGRWTIYDQKSTNGVKINNELVAGKQLLEEGDIISLGDQTLRFGEKKDMKAEIASAFAPEAIPVIQPSPSKPEDIPVSKIAFEPIAVIEDEPAPKIELREFKPDAPKIDDNNSIFKSKKEQAPEKTLTSAKVMSYIGDKTEIAKEHLSEALLKGKVNIFAGKEEIRAASHDRDNSGKHKRRFSNLLFYVIVICSAVIFVGMFIILQESQKQKPEVITEKKAIPGPFLVYYEKIKATPDNLFRFALRIEGGNAYFNVDDLKSQRHYSKVIDNVNHSLLAGLKKDIDGTTFMSLQQQPPEAAQDNMNETRTMTISCDYKINSITVKNTYAPGAFETIERSINDFAGNFGLQTIDLSPEELKARAEELYQKAEDLFQNREAKPEKLLDAIARYQMAVEYLDQFSPKPPTWDKARKRASEAEGILKTMRKDLNFEYQRFVRLKDYEKAKEISAKIMELYPQDAKEYQTFKDLNIQLGNVIKDLKKR
ncbi:MAG: FHA domain-containing protein [Victivallaceae bacterium]